VDWRFHELPARPLVRHELDFGSLADDAVEATVQSLIAESPMDAVLTIRVHGSLSDRASRVLSAANLRRLAPESMNVELRFDDWGEGVRSRATKSSDEMPELPF
jgi:hypothetical protein